VYNDRKEFFELAHRLEAMMALGTTPAVLLLDMYPWLKHAPILEVGEKRHYKKTYFFTF